ncbi:unnamed protein product [Amoebophrya sp. A120]|nr:unnamed protein product [Amoebophrya sp. A120]|eukprot:GSA120T00004757001.1
MAGIFGNTANTGGGGLFGGASNSQPPKPAGGGLFGNSTSSTSGGGLFGGGAQQQPQQPAQGGGLFGSTTNTQQPAGGGLFGNTAAAPSQPAGGGLFGNATSAAPFGSTLQPGVHPMGLVGNNAAAQQPAQNAGGGLFGSTNNAAQPSGGGGLFGGNTGQQQGGGLFGSTNNANGAAPNNAMSQQSNLTQQQLAAKTLMEQAEIQNVQDEILKLDNDRMMRNVGWTYLAVPPGVDSNVLRAEIANFSQYDFIKHGPDPNKFRMAVAQNPFDVSVALPKRILDFPQLKTHIQEQEQKLQKQEAEREALEEAIKTLRTNVEGKLTAQLETLKKTHVKLTQQLVTILTQLESSAIAVGACRRDYERERELTNHFTHMEAELQRICNLGELQYVAQGLALQDESSNQATLSKKTLQKVVNLLGNQTELNEELQSCLREKQRELQAIHQAIRIAADEPRK